jgi:uncharacterized membrane protein YgcG
MSPVRCQRGDAYPQAELFRQRTGIALYILVVPAMNEASLLRDGKRMARATANQPEMTGSVMIVITTQKPQVLLVGSYQAAQQLPDHILRLMVENQTLAYFHRGLMFQGSTPRWMCWKRR